MPMIRLLIVDDHHVVRQGVKLIVADEPDIEVVGEASDTQTGLDLIKKHRPDVLVLDLGLPGKSGLELLQDLKGDPHGPAVLVLSMYPEEQMALRTYKGGAAGYLTKDHLPEELVKAIRKVAQGGRYVSPSFAEKLAGELTADSDTPLHTKLSDREYLVLCKLATGKTVSEIADELALSVNTISTYRARVLEKLDLHTTAELIQYAIRNRLVPVGPPDAPIA